MNEAQQIIKDLLESSDIEMTPTNIIALFDDDYDMDFDVEAEHVPWSKRNDPEFKEAYDKYQAEVQAKYDQVDSRVERIGGEYGGEGEGEYCYGVIKVDGNFIKGEWSYYSYEGCNYDSIKSTLKVVTPKTKTITVYE